MKVREKPEGCQWWLQQHKKPPELSAFEIAWLQQRKKPPELSAFETPPKLKERSCKLCSEVPTSCHQNLENAPADSSPKFGHAPLQREYKLAMAKSCRVAGAGATPRASAMSSPMEREHVNVRKETVLELEKKV